MGTLQAATIAVPTGRIANLLLRAVQVQLSDAAQARTPLTARFSQHPEVTDPHLLAGWVQ